MPESILDTQNKNHELDEAMDFESEKSESTSAQKSNQSQIGSASRGLKNKQENSSLAVPQRRKRRHLAGW